jgi:peptide/nickel transport system substrate-binding protein
MHVEVMDKYMVKITLDKPLSKILFYPKVADYSGGFIVPQKAVETLGEKEFKTHPVGTGPFMFENYLPAERIIMRRNDNYFRGKPILTKINGVFMGDVTSAELALRKGELQAMIGPTEQAWVDKISQAKGIEVDVFGPGEVATISYNMKKPPLDNIKVRKAMAYAYSRKELMALFGDRIAAPMYSPVPVGLLAGGLSEAEIKEAGLDWEAGEHDINIEKAKQLLTEAGYPNGVELNVYSSEMGYYLQPYQIFQAQLRKAGINLKVNKVDHATYHSMIRKDANHIVLYNCWRPNADVYLTRFYHSASAVVTGKKPDTNFSHKEDIDQLIEQARFETDSKKQEALWKQAQLSILKDVASSTFCINRLTCARTDAFDWGHSVKASVSLYPQITETSRFLEK